MFVTALFSSILAINKNMESITLGLKCCHVSCALNLPSFLFNGIGHWALGTGMNGMLVLLIDVVVDDVALLNCCTLAIMTESLAVLYSYIKRSKDIKGVQCQAVARSELYVM